MVEEGDRIHFPYVHIVIGYIQSLMVVIDTVGTCSMLPLEDGGVVDPALRASSTLLGDEGILIVMQVYGTTNLRVVDMSIVPLHVASHTQSTSSF